MSSSFRMLIALLAMGLLIAMGGSAFAASHEEGEEFTSDFIEGEEEGVRLEVLEGYVSPGVITDSMLLNAGKGPNNWILYGKDYAHTRYSQLDEINPETIKDLVPKWVLSFGVLDSQGSQTMAFTRPSDSRPSRMRTL